MEQLLTYAIFGSFVWAAIFVGAFIIACLFAEGLEHGGLALISLIILLMVNYWWGNFPLMDLLNWTNVLLYFGVGLIFAVIRIYFYGREMGAKGYEAKNLDIKDHIFRWWTMWPISLLYWLGSKLFGDIWDLIYDRFKSTFEFILAAGVKSKSKSKK